MSLIHKIKNLDGIELSRDKDERVIRDNKWVEDLNKGDKNAFEAIYKCYYAQLYHFLVRYLSSGPAIEDTIQQVFFNVWQNRENLEPRGTLKSYLFTAVRNQAFKQLDHDNKVDRNQSEWIENYQGSEKNPELHFELEELEKAYQEAVEKLPEKRRHIFLMHRQNNLTYQEIADVLEISIKTVETQMSRSIKFLSIYLKRFR